MNSQDSREAATFSSPVRERGVAKSTMKRSAKGATPTTVELVPALSGLLQFFAVVIHALTDVAIECQPLRALHCPASLNFQV